MHERRGLERHGGESGQSDHKGGSSSLYKVSGKVDRLNFKTKFVLK